MDNVKKYIEWLNDEMNKANNFGKISNLEKNDLLAAEKWYSIAAAYQNAIEKAKEMLTP